MLGASALPLIRLISLDFLTIKKFPNQGQFLHAEAHLQLTWHCSHIRLPRTSASL